MCSTELLATSNSVKRLWYMSIGSGVCLDSTSQSSTIYLQLLHSKKANFGYQILVIFNVGLTYWQIIDLFQKEKCSSITFNVMFHINANSCQLLVQLDIDISIRLKSIGCGGSRIQSMGRFPVYNIARLRTVFEQR